MYSAANVCKHNFLTAFVRISVIFIRLCVSFCINKVSFLFMYIIYYVFIYNL